MNRSRDMETGTNEKTCLKLQEFGDMNQLYRLLDNWSKSCGMATVIVDTEGNQVSEDFGITEFCRMVQSCDKGKACCMETWKSDLDGIYECPFGFWDFLLPISWDGILPRHTSVRSSGKISKRQPWPVTSCFPASPRCCTAITVP